MKYILSLIIVASLFSCKSKTENEAASTASDKISEVKVEITGALTDLNRVLLDTEADEEGSQMLLGKINRKGLEQELFSTWYKENFEDHAIDSINAKALKPLLEGKKIKVFMGTWCEDSQREVPALFKILDHIGYDVNQLEIVAVTHDKVTPQEYEKDLSIEYVPTFIFMKDGKEMNRIVEYAHETLEKDMRTILEEKPYKHAYAE
jgi:thiol-disulfide isomerase/thioredoxin